MSKLGTCGLLPESFGGLAIRLDFGMQVVAQKGSMMSSPTGRIRHSEPNIQNVPGSLADKLDKYWEQHGFPERKQPMRTIKRVPLVVTHFQQTWLPAVSQPLEVYVRSGGILEMAFLVDASDRPMMDDLWEIRMQVPGDPVLPKREHYVGVIQDPTGTPAYFFVFAQNTKTSVSVNREQHPMAGD